MKPIRLVWLALWCSVIVVAPARAQVPVAAATDQAALLASGDPELAHNKRLVYDFWRVVLEGGHLERAADYLAPDYIQHNPNVPTGRTGFVEFFARFAKPHEVAATIHAPLVEIVAEKDLVVLSFVSNGTLPNGAGKYTTTAFDMFRVRDGMIVEHWDADRRTEH